MRLTPDLIRRSEPYLNPMKQREIGFRNMDIAIVENLGVLDDIFESLDFTDNQIVKLDGFPVLQRLDTLLVANNKVSKIANNLGSSLPNLSSLNLHNNNIANFLDIVPLRKLNHLRTLVITENPLVEQFVNWKVVVVLLLPQLTCINFQSIPDTLRLEAKKLEKQIKKGATLNSLLIPSREFITSMHDNPDNDQPQPQPQSQPQNTSNNTQHSTITTQMSDDTITTATTMDDESS